MFIRIPKIKTKNCQRRIGLDERKNYWLSTKNPEKTTKKEWEDDLKLEKP